MGIYNFKPRFVPFILDGSKTHTIRALRKHPDKPGNTLHLYTGLRQPGARLLLRAECVKVEAISIYRATIAVAGSELSREEKDLLAWRDGFRFPCDDPKQGFGYRGCFDLMLEFWVRTHQAQDVPFEGHIIHWREPKRQCV